MNQRPATRIDPRDADPGIHPLDGPAHWPHCNDRCGDPPGTHYLAGESYLVYPGGTTFPMDGWDAEPRRRDSTRIRFEWLLIAVVIIVAIATLLAMRATPSEAVQGRGVSPVLLRGAPSPGCTPGCAMGPEVRASAVGSSLYPDPAAGGAPRTVIAPVLYGGTATYCAPTPTHCQGWGGDAHLGAMASFTYGDKPYVVTVRHGKASTAVLVVSHCACGVTLIDLSPAAFDDLAPLKLGRIPVTVERGAALPNTDTETP